MLVWELLFVIKIWVSESSLYLNNLIYYFCKYLYYNFKERSTRKCLLQCLVPRKKLPKRTVNVLLKWFFSNLHQPLDASLALYWLSGNFFAFLLPINYILIPAFYFIIYIFSFLVMISHNLIDAESVGILINQFLMCLFIKDLVW